MDYCFDLIVLGAGSGGLAAAKKAASHGARVAVVEGDRVGGTCVIRGCVPKKLLVYGSQYGDYLRNASGFGVQIKQAKIESSILLENIRREVDRLNKLHISLLSKANVELIKGWGKVSDPNTVQVKESDFSSKTIELSTKNILIAVGGRPVRPKIPGASLGWVSDDLFLQERFPDNVVVVGAGFIACEIACILNGLGVSVKQLVRGTHLLKNFDKEISFLLQNTMKKKGIDIQYQCEVKSLEGKKGDLILHKTEGDHIKTEAVLFATGREPFLEGLDLDKAGIKVGKNKIIVDERNKTNIANIFAVGDVTNRVNLTPVAIEEGRVLAENLFGNQKKFVDYENIPKAVFSQPEIAFVGFTEEEAIAKFGKENIEICRSKFKPMSSMLPKVDEQCLLKLIINKVNNKVLGCHMLGYNASEIIQMASIAVRMGATKYDFDKTMALHPTIAEEFVTMR